MTKERSEKFKAYLAAPAYIDRVELDYDEYSDLVSRNTVLEDENAALRRELQDSEAKGYKRGLEAAVNHIKHNAVQTKLLINPNSPRKYIEEWGVYVLDQTWRELEKKAAPDTEAGDKM